jgi:hypothetical protein
VVDGRRCRGGEEGRGEVEAEERRRGECRV